MRETTILKMLSGGNTPILHQNGAIAKFMSLPRKCTVLYTKNDADLLVHLFLDGMKKLKLAYLPLVFLCNLRQS